jgi:acyl carrier protein
MVKSTSGTQLDRAAVFKGLTGIFRTVFGREIKIFDTLFFESVLGWDSLTQVRLIAAIEREFKISFSITEIMSSESVGVMMDLILSKKRRLA